MNLIASLKYVFVIQKILRISLLTTDGNNRMVLKTWSKVLSALLVIMVILGSLCSLQPLSFIIADFQKMIVDQTVFSTLIGMLPGYVVPVCAVAIWIDTFVSAKAELQFYTKLDKLDRHLQDFIDIEWIYRHSLKYGRKWFRIIILLNIFWHIPTVCFMYLTGFMHETMLVSYFLQLSHAMFYACTYRYCQLVRNLTWRLCALDTEICKGRIMGQSVGLLKIQSGIRDVVKSFNDCFGTSQGYSAFVCFIYCISIPYMIFTLTFLDSPVKISFRLVLSFVLAPHLWSLALVFWNGESFKDVVGNVIDIFLL